VPGIGSVAGERRSSQASSTWFGLAEIEDIVVPALGEVVGVLHRGVDPPGVAVFLEDPEAVLERGLEIDAVQVIERDRVDAEALEALLDLGPQPLGVSGAGPVAALRRDDCLARRVRERRPTVRSLSPPV
jgi:hypothetical protein